MQQDKFNIENKLRALEGNRLPDLTHMDGHWQKMQVMLQSPGITINKTSGNIKYIKWLLPATAMIVISLWCYHLFITKTPAIDKDQTPEAILKTANKKKTPQNPVNAIIPVLVKDKKTSKTNPFNQPNKRDRITAENPAAKEDDFKINFTDCSDCDKKNDSIQHTGDKTNMLNAFMGLFEKKSQQFIINNTKDTVIVCSEGTTVFIPGHSFNTTGPVLFEVKEFYKYSDMVLNKLVTKSGDDRLESGGMLHFSATRNGSNVVLNPANPIRVYLPGVTSKDSMSIFEGVTSKGNEASVDMLPNTGFINWQLSTIRIDSPVYKMLVRAIDLRDNLAVVNYSWSGKSKALFFRAKHSEYNKDELKSMLEKKYGTYYDKIKVRKHWGWNGEDEEYSTIITNPWGVGDTAELLPGSIRIYKLQPIDTVYKIVYWIRREGIRMRTPNLTPGEISKIGEKYSIEINKLGWINCDRFSNYKGRKIDYAVDLKDSANNYYTFLVFDNYKSIMNGYISNGTKVLFPNIPINEPVKVISIGIDKNGRSVSAIKETNISGSVLNDLQFEPTSAEALKKSLSRMDK